jgi:uncharacterized protein DUF4154
VIRALCAALVLVALAGSAPVRAEVPPDKQAMVLLRLLAYDRQLARKTSSRVVVAVVRDDGDAVSRRSASAMTAALRSGAKAVTVIGKPVVVVEIAAGPLFADRLRNLEVDALFLAAGLDAEAAEVTRAARARPCLTFGEKPSYLRYGVAIVLGTDQPQRRITISVDLEAARAQGARLSAELLRVAKVVKR